jgi:hypothetical protein
MGLLLQTPMASSFLPTQVPNCVGWWDPTDNSTITVTSSHVTQWNDKSGLGNNLTGSGTVKTPVVNTTGINSRQSIQFTQAPSVSAFLATTLTANLTTFSMFAVIRPTVLTGSDVGILGGGVATGDITFALDNTSAGLEAYVVGTGGLANTPNSVISANTNYVVTLTYSGSVLNIYINNVLQTGSPATHAGSALDKAFGLCAGAAAGFLGMEGHYGHVCLYSNVISSANRTNLYSRFLKPYAGTP